MLASGAGKGHDDRTSPWSLPMSFQAILDQLIERVPESIAATFNDKDGDPICARTIEVSNDALQLLGAYRNVLDRHLRQAIEDFDQGVVEQVAFCTSQHWILMMGAAEHCVLVLVMRRDGILGRARFQMEQAVARLNQEF
jgi:predicted regulator of Ras-like GTPase activity (Roadblock/LC7/MglB family)